MQVKDANRSRRISALCALACFLLQLGISPNFGMGNGRANFMMIFAGAYALYAGGRAGVVAGFLSGFAFDLVTTGPFGLMSALMTVFAFGLGREARNRFADGLVSSLTSFGVGSLATLAAYNLAMLLVGESASIVDLVFLRTFPSFALTFVCFLPVASYLVQSSARGHGIGSGGRSASSKHGNRYDVRGI